jgi:integrase
MKSRISLSDFKNHWHAVLREAGITGFTWHDLKHCAITWMLDNGYSERDLKNLGIQYSRSLIDRYYHHDAVKVVVKWRAQKAAACVAPGCGTFAEKTANFA